ncbi:MAG: hypothetical protein FWE48_04675, partial [Coriobacteriia bacterium]|nr:hypothetical protein [Coriobacteriia bacterium]
MGNGILVELLTPVNALALMVEIALIFFLVWAVKIYLANLGFEVSMKNRLLIVLVMLPLFLIDFLATIDALATPLFIVWPITVLTLIFLCSTIARGSRLLVFFAGVILNVLILLSEVIVAIPVMAFELRIDNTPDAILFSILLTTLSVLVIMLVSRHSRAKGFATAEMEPQKAAYFLIAIACSGIVGGLAYSAMLDTVFIEGNYLPLSMLPLVVAAFVIVIVMVVMYFLVDSQARMRQENSIYQQQVEFYSSYLQEKEADHLYSKMVQHDQKQHFIYLLHALEENQVEKGISYLRDILQDIPTEGLLKTDNLVIDSLINSKREQLKRSRIELALSINVPERIGVDDVDFCIIL